MAAEQNAKQNVVHQPLTKGYQPTSSGPATSAPTSGTGVVNPAAVVVPAQPSGSGQVKPGTEGK
jgi:hypothetical protein